MAQFDLIVIGSGPGGYIAAIRGAQLGLATAIVEKDPAGLGGTCLRRGCIPAKAWLETAHRYDQMSDLADYGIAGVDVSALKADLAAIVKRKNRIVLKNGKGVEFLMKKNKVTFLKGTGRLLGGGKVEVSGETHEARRIILATGSVPKELPGMETDGVRVVNSDHLLDMTELPSSLVILGAGAIGVEFASVFARLGSKVTLVEFMDRILPIEDASMGEELAKILAKKDKIDVRVKTKIASIERFPDKVVCHLEGEKGGVVECSHLLVAVGRGPVTAGVGLEATKAVVDRGFVTVDAYLATAEPGLYAIGDIVKTPMLAHVASDEGIVAAEHAAKSLGKDVHPHPINYDRVPSVTYCDPEVGCIGLTEAQAREKGHDVQVGSFPFMPLAKANIIGEPHGFVKIVADRKYGEILGIHIIGPKATELVASSLALLGGEYTVDELINTMYPHPTLNEAFPEAARAVYGRALNA
ncbi:dihydrolipoyl dehydrogenase [Mesoterricola silvestris]|uniref:Dihydrolipoyl dehydrogenase n=1 Tax=Mesoterricola silvestris TaxID=2927979 RepID=A0AA48H2E5_9BACT|nr:dihydrolipoyl dehydrogenase [Mesoterricola silvestris]BDU74758.1 dihydrolipoyl dehydrogenase [Mesoterricola silvestris]